MDRTDGPSALIVNLKRARKAASRTRKAAEAERNRIHFGLTPAQKAEQKQTSDEAARRLDGHKREPNG